MTKSKTYLSLFLFELIFRALSLFILRSVGEALISMMLQISGDEVLFNFNMLRLLLSMPGIAAIVLILCLSSLLTYFEFSVIFLKLYGDTTGHCRSISATMKHSLATFMSISNWGIAGYFLYSVLLLPFEAILLRPSVMPSVEIPNFITGEFSKRWYGTPVLNAAYFLLFLLFLALLFVLPSMILKKNHFIQAVQNSLMTWKECRKRWLLPLFAVIAVWMLLFTYPGFLSDDFSGLFQENMLKTLCMLFFSPRALLLAIKAVLLWGLKTVLMLVFCQMLLSCFVSVNQTSLPRESAVASVEQRISDTKNIIARLYFKVYDYFQPLLKRIHITKGAALWSLAACALAFVLFVYRISLSPPSLHEPLNIGHRGSDLGVENTLEAVEGAIQSGADFVELDIQLSGDGIPVAMHDDNLTRLANHNAAVNELTAEELAQYPLSQYDTTGVIPTLEELLQKTGSQIRMLIEFKAGSDEDKKPLVDAVLDLIEKYDYEERCIVMSLDYDMVQMARAKNPELKVGYCMFGNLGEVTAEDLWSLNVDFVVIEENMVHKQFVTACRQAWLPVYVWTVDDADSMEQYLDMGVSGLISDKPYLTKEILPGHQNGSGKDAVVYYWG